MNNSNTNEKFKELVEKAIKDKDKNRYGFSINSPTSVDPTELFLGEYTSATSNVSLKDDFKENKKESKNKFINQAAYYPKSKDENPRFEADTKCEILTLNDKKDLERFNELLTAKNNPKATIKLLTMDKQYSQQLNTWQIFVIYEVIKPINIVKP